MAARQDFRALGPQRAVPDIEPALKVGIVPTPDFSLMPFAGFVEFLRYAADESDFSRKIFCSWQLLSHNLQPIRSSCGSEITPDQVFGDPRDFDYIVVHGGLLYSSHQIPDELYDFVEKAHGFKVPIVGLCTGTFVMAELGLLVGRRCAVHFSVEAAFRKAYPDVIAVTDLPMVQDGPFLTSPGGLASINVAMALIEEHCGRNRVQKALDYVLADWRPETADAHIQGPNVADLRALDKRLAQAVMLMRQKPYESLSLSEIASKVGTSKRELTRLFQRHLRQPPGAFWRDMRLSSAHWMVVNTDRSITSIAHECGFNDSSHLIRYFKTRYGATPANVRRVKGRLGVH